MPQPALFASSSNREQRAERLAALLNRILLGAFATDPLDRPALQYDQPLGQRAVREGRGVGHCVHDERHSWRRVELLQLGREALRSASTRLQAFVLRHEVGDRLVEPAIGGMRLLKVDKGKVGAIAALALPRQKRRQLREEWRSGARSKIKDERPVTIDQVGEHHHALAIIIIVVVVKSEDHRRRWNRLSNADTGSQVD